MNFKTWLEHKRIKLIKDYKHSETMITKIENGEKVPYGRDYGADLIYYGAQLELIENIQKKF